MEKEAKGLLDRAAKYIAKGLETGAYAETVGGNRVAEQLLEGIRRYRTEPGAQAADVKRLLDRAAQYIGKGLADGVYAATVGGNLFAERLLAQLQQLRGSKATGSKGPVRHATKKSTAQLQREIDEVLASPGSYSYEEAMEALNKKHSGVKRGGSLRSGHTPVVPKMTRKTRWAPSHATQKASDYTKLATATSVPRIEKYINEYAFSTNYRVDPETLQITNPGKVPPESWFVMRHRGGYLFGRKH